MQKWQIEENWAKEGQWSEETQPFKKRLNSVIVQVMEIFLGVAFLFFVLWVGNQAWQNPLIFNIPMLVFSLAALGGGLLFLWLIYKQRNSTFNG